MVGRRDIIMTTTALFTLGACVSAVAPSRLMHAERRSGRRRRRGGHFGRRPALHRRDRTHRTPRRADLISELMVTIGILLAYIGLELFADEPSGVSPGRRRGPGPDLSGLALLLVESPVWLALMGDRRRRGGANQAGA